MLPLFDNQKETIAFASTRERVYDASDPGTGKTRSTIEIYAARRLQGAGCLLVLAPKSLLKSAWANDFLQFAPQLVTSVAYASNREKAFEANADVYITNIDATTWLAKQKPAFFAKFKDGMLVLDEADAYKHHTSARSKALNKIKGYFRYRQALSGTPDTNSITDLWHQYFILDDGQRLGKSFYGFRNNACEAKQSGPLASMVKWTDKPGIEAVVGHLIKDITIRHKLEDCVSIPENFLSAFPYELAPAQQKAYQEMAESAIAMMLTGELVEAINGAAVRTKLLQIAAGAVYDGYGGYHVLDTGRYELTADLVAQRRHCVVFFLWKHQRDLLIDEFQRRGITYVVVDGDSTDAQREEAVAHFQAGFYRVFLAHPKSAAHGLTLVKGTSTIWPSPTDNLGFWIQGNRRVYRAGQTQKTETVVVVAPNTIEERVSTALQTKDVRQLSLLHLLEGA